MYGANTRHLIFTHKKIPVAYQQTGTKGREFNAFANKLAGT